MSKENTQKKEFVEPTEFYKLKKQEGNSWDPSQPHPYLQKLFPGQCKPLVKNPRFNRIFGKQGIIVATADEIKKEKETDGYKDYIKFLKQNQ